MASYLVRNLINSIHNVAGYLHLAEKDAYLQSDIDVI